MLSEGSGQVTLIRETCVGSDGGQWEVRHREFAGGKFDPQPAHILSDCAAIEGPEDANQMNRMYLGYFSDFSEAQTLRKVLVQKLSRAFKPDGMLSLISFCAAGYFGHDFDTQAFDYQRRIQTR